MPGPDLAVLVRICWLFSLAATPAICLGVLHGASLLIGLAAPCLLAVTMAAEPKHALA